MSLRARLLVVMLLVTTVGLLTANFVTHRLLASFLYDRVDSQLSTASQLAEAVLGFSPQPRPPPQTTDLPAPFPSGTYVAILDSQGAVIDQQVFSFAETSPSPPDLASSLSEGGAGGAERRFLSVNSVDGNLEYRVLAVAAAEGTLVAAIPLTDVVDTLNRLLLIELFVTVGALGMLSGLSWWLVRVGFRPLEQMGRAADAIAAGDLARRVTPATSRTEVGRLGLALNAMLERIEIAFAERRASEARLRRFVADASHELRTPLTSLRGYAELFRRGAAERPADLERAMRRIEEEGTRMAKLVDELALLARLDEGRPLEPEGRDLVELASAAVEAARIAWPERQIDLDAPSPVMASVDAARFRQIVDNLLSNAAQHTPERKAVRVRVRHEDLVALVEVEDQGAGIDDEHAERVFERFYRVDPSRSRETGGSGLGLSIVAALAEAHGGTATYERGREGGALFKVRLPLDPTRLSGQNPQPPRSGYSGAPA